MHNSNHDIKTNILSAALPDIAFDGWTFSVLEKAALQSGYTKDMALSVFPAGTRDALVHFARMADQAMLQSLSNIDSTDLKIRERIALAIEKRLEFLQQHREAERLAVAFWLRPFRKLEGAKILWNTADAIWKWAGDTSTDYNRYTERALLSGVLSASTLFWLSDREGNMSATKAFITRRIDNVLYIGKTVSSFKKSRTAT